MLIELFAFSVKVPEWLVIAALVFTTIAWLGKVFYLSYYDSMVEENNKLYEEIYERDAVLDTIYDYCEQEAAKADGERLAVFDEIATFIEEEITMQKES